MFAARLLAFLGLLLLGSPQARCQGGAVDPDFSIDGVPDGYVKALVQQPDKKIILAGDFTKIGTATTNRVARLNVDGTIDPTFNPGSGPDQEISKIVLQTNGKLVIAGNFGSVGGVTRRCVARLNPDGSLDPAFSVQTTVSGYEINDLALQTDGKILVGGSFHSFSGTTYRNLVRLNSDGSIDTGFSQLTGLSGNVNSIAVQGNGRILIAGVFSSINGVTRKNIARLNANGSLDTSFDAGAGLSAEASRVMLQTDGTLLVQADFAGTTAADSRRGIVRLNANGSLDPSFDAGTAFGAERPEVTLDSGNRMVASGEFTNINGHDRLRVGRLQSDGSVDPLFEAGNTVAAGGPILVQHDGKVVVAAFAQPIVRFLSEGDFPPGGPPSVISGIPDSSGVRLTWSDGNREEGYRIERSPDGTDWAPAGIIAAGQPRRYYGGGLVAGATHFYRVRAINRFGNGPVSATISVTVKSAPWAGQVDLAFDPAIGGIQHRYDSPTAIAQADGKVVAWVSYRKNANDITRWVVARFNADGTLDRLYDAVSEYAESRILMQQPDGKLLVAGNFKVSNATIPRGFARFNTDGTEDSGFSVPVWSPYGYGSVLATARQADGKLLIAGYFDRVHQSMRNHIARLNLDGSVDTTFSPGTGPNGPIGALALDSAGRIVIGGNFNSVNGTPSGSVARLLPSGSVDPAFGAIPGASSMVKCLAIQPDDRVLIGGQFTTYNASPCNRGARLNSDGSLDNTFSIPAGPTEITAIHRQGDGRVLIAGSFTRLGGVSRSSVARLLPTGLLDLDFVAGGTANFTGFAPYSVGKVLAFGNVTLPDGSNQSGIARLSIAGGSPPPPTPVGLTAVSVNASQIRLAWTDGTGENAYFIERAAGSPEGWTHIGQSPADTPSFIDTGLQEGTRYFYRLVASNPSGVSSPSAGADAYTLSLPLVPTHFEARSHGGSRAVLTWKSSGYAENFVIERSAKENEGWSFVASLSLYDDSFVDANLAPETEYFYRVRAVNSGGDSVATVSTGIQTGNLGAVPAGSLDPTFVPGSGLKLYLDTYYAIDVRTVLQQPDGKLLVAGHFGKFAGVPRINIVRIHPDGSIDPTFNPGGWNCTGLAAAALAADGKVVVAGVFLGADGFTGPDVMRLNTDGTIDTGFNATETVSAARYSAFYHGIQSLALQPDGKVLVGGSSLLRLNPDGSKDNGFLANVAGGGFTPWIYDLSVLPAGKIMLSGLFTSINGTIRRDLARLNADGSVDAAFDAGFAYSSGNGFSYGRRLAIQPDGKILWPSAAYSLTGIDRFNTDGTFDATFNGPRLNSGGSILIPRLQSDGKIIVGGSFDTIGNFRFQGIARLNPDGTVDPTFDTGSGIPGVVTSVKIQEDGAVLIGGIFSIIEGQPRSSIARLLGNPVTWDSLQRWKIQFGLSPLEPDGEDLDSDGMTGLVEYALGGDPTAPDRQILPSASVTSGHLTMTYQKFRPDISYQVEISTDLRTWTPDGVLESTVPPDVTASVPAGAATARFMRLLVRRP